MMMNNIFIYSIALINYFHDFNEFKISILFYFKQAFYFINNPLNPLIIVIKVPKLLKFNLPTFH